MGRLPTADDLGFNHPSAGLAVIKQPESGLAEGLQTLGRTIAAIGLRDRAEQEKFSKYKLKSDLENFQWDQKIAYQQVVDTSAEDGSDIWARREAELQKVKKDWDKRPMSPEERAMVDDVFNGVMGQQRFAAYEDARTKRFAWQEKDIKWGADRTLSQGISDQKTFDSWWNAQVAKIDATDLPIEMKDKLKSEIATAGALKFGSDNPQAFIGSQQQGQGGAQGGDAPSLIRKFEGFREKPYYDVNAYRAGYGSDTVTMTDGRILRIRPGMKVSRDDAERDLARRSAISADDARKAVGDRAWGALNDNQQAALTSIAYNYGSLPKSVVEAIKSGSVENIATSVEGLKSHNGGINAKRRQEEANIIRGVEVSGQESPTFVSNRKPTGGMWDYVSLDDWEKIRNSTIDSYKTSLKDSIDLGIEQSSIARDDIVNAPIDDGDKAVLLRRWDQRNKDAASVSDFVSRLNGGGFINPKDNKDRAAADLLINGVGGAEAIASGDDKAVSAMFEIWDKAGLLPNGPKGAIEGMLRSKDQNKVNAALSYMDALDARNHRAFQQEFDEKSEALMLHYRDNLAFATPEESANTVMKSSDPVNDAIRKERGKEAEKTAAKLAIGDVMEKFDPSYLPFDQPDMPVSNDTTDQLMADYRRLYVEAYKQSGDDEAAQKIAAKQLTRVWGAAVANGGRVMKYPPESLYGPSAMVDGSFDWMKDSVEKDLVAAGFFKKEDSVIAGGKGGAKHADTKVPRQHFLLADRQTTVEAKAGKPASYQLWVIDENGAFDLVPKRVYFDVAPYRNASRATATVQQNMNLETRKQKDAVDSIAKRRQKILESGTRY